MLPDINIKNPYFLYLLIPYFILIFYYLYRKIYLKNSAIPISSKNIVTIRSSFRVKTYRYLPILRFLSIFILIIALSRPGKEINYSSVKNLGIDIMIALDVSGSMKGEDFKPKNRLAVAKEVIKDFISKRKNDRIGLVVFAGEAYLQAPLTIEYDILFDILDELNFRTVSVNGTAIGDAIALATSRMMDKKSKSKIILLLTDGVSNTGIIDPETASKASANLGVKIYTVGIGKDGMVTYPTGNRFFNKKQKIMNNFDETILKKSSKITGGKFYRATSSGVLWNNIQDIDRLEKNEMDIKIYHEYFDKFEIFLLIAISIFFIEIILRSIVYRKIP